MNQEFRLESEEDVEAILRIAIRRESGGTETGLDQHLLAAARELGISGDALDAAKAEYLQQKRNRTELAEFQNYRLQGLRGHAISYFGVNTMLILMDFFRDQSISWSIYPLLGWGIGMAIHAGMTLLTKPTRESDEFIEWKA